MKAATRFRKLSATEVEDQLKTAAALNALREEKRVLQKELDRLGEWIAENRPAVRQPGESHVDAALRLLAHGDTLLDRDIDAAIGAHGLVRLDVARLSVKTYLDQELLRYRRVETSAEQRRRDVPPATPKDIKCAAKDLPMNRFLERQEVAPAKKTRKR